MSLKLQHLDPKLRQRIARQINEEDRNKIINVVGALQASVPKPAIVPALESGKGQQRQRKVRLNIRVFIIQFRKRLLDRIDNRNSACKGLIDSIAKTVRLDDNDSRITWQIEQIKTNGEEGCVVKIEYEE